MLIFAVLGALVAWAFQEKNLRKALFLGIGLPSLFQAASLQSVAPSTTPPSRAPGTQASISLVSSAYAQPPSPPSPSAATRTLNLSASRNIAYTVAFYGTNNSLISSAPVTNSGSVPIPKDAAMFAIQVGGSTSTSYELPKTSAPMTNADVKINEKPTAGFFQGLGLAKAPQYAISVRVH